MGLSESAIKVLMDPINNLITNCGHSDCKTRCCNCFELEIDSTHTVNSTPILQAREESRESNVSNVSNVTKIVERND